MIYGLLLITENNHLKLSIMQLIIQNKKKLLYEIFDDSS